MSIKVNLMSFLSDYTGGKNQIFLEGGCRTVGEVLAALIRLHPALKDELLDEEGKLDYFYQIILNGDKVEWEQISSQPVKDGDEIVIFGVLGGG
ncbi:MAG: MoaD/ThiS family protein [Bacillota bacterium]